MNTNNALWVVGMSAKAAKGRNNLPLDIKVSFMTLFELLRQAGPVQPKWPHYSQLRNQKKETHHCHLNKGRPVYVAIWSVLDKQKKILEVTYVGTHENAPY